MFKRRKNNIFKLYSEMNLANRNSSKFEEEKNDNDNIYDFDVEYDNRLNIEDIYNKYF